MLAPRNMLHLCIGLSIRVLLNNSDLIRSKLHLCSPEWTVETVGVFDLSWLKAPLKSKWKVGILFIYPFTAHLTFSVYK